MRGIRCCIHIGFAKSFAAEVAELKAECQTKTRDELLYALAVENS